MPADKSLRTRSPGNVRGIVIACSAKPGILLQLPSTNWASERCVRTNQLA